MVDAVSAATDKSALGRTRLAESFDTFLALLTAQLKNQDPLSPLDSNQFTQQIVQMTGVEQQLLTNDLLKSLVANTTNGVATAVSLIGKEVRAATTDAKLQNGKAEWIYTLPRDANDVKIEVLDSRGKVVKVLPPVDKGTKAGDHKVTWDGKDANGTKMPDGIYSLRVSAKDSDYATVPTMISIEGMVTGVEQSNGETLITVNGAPVLWNHITTIKQAQAAPTPTGTGGDTPNPPPTTAED
ncbi:flagellar hook assembly protein FlgD [Phenylobacterium sp. J426]|uniref:flagellar hook assembly protein FlgD n=1 Tax=Phenylobacterium sp. J426 TaxID=2898439 RepID=UPI002150C744|nr:flagellar hook assembly protein FlgD [Phenylobacterium sp. J426]MCR5874744.1 flagellar hook assembly protein FlgD [Phenylobacterium sp. J426]